jgi:hypothetical protein
MKIFFWIAPLHDQHQPARSHLGQDAEHDAQAPRHFGGAQKNGEALAHADALAPCLGFFQVTPAAGGEDHAHHKSEKQKSEVGESSELRKHGYFLTKTKRR